MNFGFGVHGFFCFLQTQGLDNQNLCDFSFQCLRIMREMIVGNYEKHDAKLRPSNEGCTARVRMPVSFRSCAVQPSFEGRSLTCIKDTKIMREMQVFDWLF